MASDESNIMGGAFRLLEKHIDDRHKDCDDCKRLYWHILRAVTKWLESEGRPAVFSNGSELPEPDTPETAGAKMKQVMEVDKLALQIFGRKKG
jgi:hypothetical protein